MKKKGAFPWNFRISILLDWGYKNMLFLLYLSAHKLLKNASKRLCWRVLSKREIKDRRANCQLKRTLSPAISKTTPRLGEGCQPGFHSPLSESRLLI